MEGFSINIYLFFLGINYFYWETRTTLFLNPLIMIFFIQNGPHILNQIENEVVIPKPS